MVLVFFLAPKIGTGLSCTIYKIPVKFSLSLDMKSGTSNLNKWYRKFRSFRLKREKGNSSKGITFFRKISTVWFFHTNGMRFMFAHQSVMRERSIVIICFKQF